MTVRIFPEYTADQLAEQAARRAEVSAWWDRTNENGEEPSFEALQIERDIEDQRRADEHSFNQGGGRGRSTGWTPPVALTDDDCAAWLAGLGRKVEVDEVTGAHVLCAERWLAAYTGDFEFLLDVRRKARRGLSNGQAKGVLNCWRADLVRSAARAPKASETVTETASPTIPAGHYAVASRTGNNDLDFFRVDHGKGNYAGRVFVKRIIGGTPDQNVRGAETKLALEAIAAAGPEAAAKLYGTELGQCSRCNRHLTDETSRALGIGPECRSK